MKKRYYSLVEDATNDVADLYIFGDITSWGQWEKDDPDRSAYNIVDELREIMASNINVHINSYGGDVFEGLAIYNTLRGSGKHITTICDGCACSAASVVFMAGTERIMSRASLLMIHNAWTIAIGNSDELHKQADDLETITQASVEVYKQAASISEEESKELMDNETWILPEQAKEWGFATSIDEEETDGVKQSAFGLIMQKLTAPEAVVDEVKGIEFNPDDIAERVVAALKKEKKTKKGKDEEVKKPVVVNKWEEFFGGNK